MKAKPGNCTVAYRSKYVAGAWAFLLTRASLFEEKRH